MRILALATLTLLIFGARAGRADNFAFVVTTDFSTGSSSKVCLDGAYTTDTNVASINSDAICRYFDGFIYVVNRFLANNIQILDPSNNFSTVRQFTTGASSNPHDILVISPTKAYVTLYSSASLLIVNPSTGAQTGLINLSAYGGTDGIPDMDTMARVGDLVFVTLQRLVNFFPSGLSQVVVIDSNTDAIVDVDPATAGIQAIDMAETNPFSEIKLDPFSGMLYTASVGDFGVQDGGVEFIDPVALRSAGIVFEETEANGDVNDVEMVSATKGYAIVSNAVFNKSLIAFNPETGDNLGSLYAPAVDGVLWDVKRAPDGTLMLADGNFTLPGIRVFDTFTDTQITSSPIDVGLPPFDICFCQPVQTGIGDTPVQALTIGSSYPNPFNPQTTIPYSLDRRAHVRLSIYDVAGNIVRRLIDAPRELGGHVAEWDGRDDRSDPLPSGIYFAHLRAAGQTLSQKLVLLK